MRQQLLQMGSRYRVRMQVSFKNIKSMREIICRAIRERRLLTFFYEGGPRFVEPHAYGTTTQDNPGLRAFQTDGFSSTATMGWKMFDMSKASHIRILETKFGSPRTGYKRGDKGLKAIDAQL
jgi:hypothetical protein